jgi:hypothetical protein
MARPELWLRQPPVKEKLDMTARAWIVKCAVPFVMLAPLAALGQDPCEEIGSDCREMTAAERKGFEERMVALRAALPAPDPEGYTRSSVESFVESMTSPVGGTMNAAQAPLTCRSWAAGCFPEEANLGFTYSRREDLAKADEKTQDPVKLSQQMASEFENQVQVSAWLRPYPFLVANVDGKCVDVEDETATAIEKTASFLTYRTGDEESGEIHLVVGPRTCKEEDVEPLEQPAKVLAPVVAVEVLITGPTSTIIELAQKIDRKQFASLLGPVVK